MNQHPLFFNLYRKIPSVVGCVLGGGIAPIENASRPAQRETLGKPLEMENRPHGFTHDAIDHPNR